MRQRIEYYLARFTVVVVSCLFAFATIEFCSRYYLTHFATHAQQSRYATPEQLGDVGAYGRISDLPSFLAIMPHRFLGHALRPGYVFETNRHNSLGFRGDEIAATKAPGEFRIVCLGESTTYGAYIDDYKKSYPWLLQQKLRSQGYTNVTVINAAAIGYTSLQSLISLETRILDLSPDLLIVYHGINDLEFRFAWPPSAYRGDRDQFDARVPATASLLEHSTFIRYFMIRMGIWKSPLDIASLARPRTDLYYEAFLDQKCANTYPSGIFRDVSVLKMLEVNKPIYLQRNIENIISIAKSRGIDVVLASFAWSPLFTDLPRASSPEYVAGYREQNAMIEKVAKDANVHFLDFANCVPKDRKFYIDGYHFNERGTEVQARIFAKYITDQHLVEKRTGNAGS